VALPAKLPIKTLSEDVAKAPANSPIKIESIVDEALIKFLELSKVIP